MCSPVIVGAQAELVKLRLSFQHAPHVIHVQIAEAEHLCAAYQTSSSLAH